MSEDQNSSFSNNAASDKEYEDSHPANPYSSEIDSETRDKLRGDAIGDTLYSESFVVKTLMQLSNNIQWCKKLEDDLCFLWDSTIEKDVCYFLIKLSYPSIASNVITTTDEARLIEIIIGILANICCTLGDPSIVNDREIELVLTMLYNDDPLVLIQVVRFVKAVSYNSEKLPFISESLLEQFCFILTNSINYDLIINTLDALAKVTVYNKIDIQLVIADFIKSSCVAYQTIQKNSKTHDILPFTHLVRIISNICTYINETSSEYTLDLLSNINMNIDTFLSNLKEIFKFYANAKILLPLEEEIIYIVDTLVFVFQILNIKYNQSIFKSLTSIISILITNDWKDIGVFLEFYCYFMFVGNCDEIKQDLNMLSIPDVVVILKKIKESNSDYQFNYVQNFNNLYEEYVTD